MISDFAGTSAVSVLVATPRPVLVEGLRTLFTELDWPTPRMVKKLADVAKIVKRTPPALLLLDAEWPEDDLYQTLAVLLEEPPPPKVALLYESLEPTARMRALLAGCTAIVDCKQSTEQLRSDLQQIAALPLPQPWGELGRLYQYLVHPVEKLPGCEHLSLRECQVLRLLGWGLSNDEIARAMRLSLDTIKEHLRRLFKKMSFTDRAQAAVWAVRQGLIDFTL